MSRNQIPYFKFTTLTYTVHKPLMLDLGGDERHTFEYERRIKYDVTNNK